MKIKKVLKFSNEKFSVQARTNEGNDVTINVILSGTKPNVIFENFPDLETSENISSVIKGLIDTGHLVRKV